MAEKKEPTPEELLKVAQEENKILAAELKAANETLEQRVKDLDASEEKLQELNDQISSQNEVIKELNEALEAKDSEVNSLGKRPVFKSGKKKIELRIKKFIHNFKGERIEVDQKVLEANPELVDELLKIKSAALKEIGGK